MIKIFALVVMLTILSDILGEVASDPWFIVVSRNDIRRSRLDSKTSEIMYDNLISPIDLDFKYSDNNVYWTDTNSKKIMRAPFNSTEDTPDEFIGKGLESPYGVTVDWIHNNIYWTEIGTNARIAVADKSGQYVKTLIDSGLTFPWAIVVDPKSGWLFWSDYTKQGRIEKCGLNGKYRRVIVPNLNRPVGMTIDYVNRRLYWIERGANTIGSSNMDGGQRIDRRHSGNRLNDPYFMTVFGGSLFWTESKAGMVRSVDISTGSNYRYYNLQLKLPRGIKVFDPTRQPFSRNHCGENNGGCQQLCLPDPGHSSTLNAEPNYMCVCADNDSECLPNICGAGYEYTTNITSNCMECQIGFYREKDSANPSCKKCNSKFITLSTGSTSVKDCNITACFAGEYLDTTKNRCEQCEDGYYQDQINQKSCKKCCDGSYRTGKKGATKAEDCKAMAPIKPSEYRGILSTTINGRTCQEWQLNTPHSHRYHKGPSNFCRDPDNTGVIWCYTTDPNVRWERCDQRVLSQVPHYIVITHPSADYAGTLNTTINGRTCQQWQSNVPHEHGYNSLPSNYCRNPDGEPTIWCYTTDPNTRWELCDNNALVEIISTQARVISTTEYKGTLRTTLTGKTCRYWNSISADIEDKHKHLPNNFCRDPDSEGFLWCYTERKEKCDPSVLTLIYY